MQLLLKMSLDKEAKEEERRAEIDKGGKRRLGARPRRSAKATSRRCRERGRECSSWVAELAPKHAPPQLKRSPTYLQGKWRFTSLWWKSLCKLIDPLTIVVPLAVSGRKCTGRKLIREE